MKEIVVQITSKSLSKSYVINLDDDFAINFQKEWKKLTAGEKFIDAGTLLEAYIQKSYENFMLSQKIDVLFESEIKRGIDEKSI